MTGERSNDATAAISELSLTPTLALQCWGFMIGSTLFAIGSAPIVSAALGTTGSNVAFFTGAWFFTAAAFTQLFLSGPATTTTKPSHRPGVRAVWLAAASQAFGTVLFNISTSAALHASSVTALKKLVWGPNADGSAAFLISSGFAILVLYRQQMMWAPRSRDWLSTWLGTLGSVAFGVSAVGSIITPSGAVRDGTLASWGTFVGALCFFAAAAVLLKPARRSPSVGQQP